MKPLNFIAWCFAAIAVLALNTGCAGGSKDRGQEAARAEAGFTPQQWATQISSDERAQAQAVDWLASFSDPQLQQLTQLALNHNYNLTAAAANVDRARAQVVQAGAGLRPQLNLSLSNNRAGSVDSSDFTASEHSLSGQLSWEVDLWGRLRAGQAAARASLEAAAADYKFSQHSIAANTAKAYFAAVEAGQQVTILREILDSLTETLRIVDVQHENGLASAQDLALTKADLASNREQLIALEASQRDALRALEILLGRYPSGDLLTATALPSLPPMPPVGVPADVLERRPDLVASERRVAAAFNALDQARAARLPQLSLTSAVGGSSAELNRVVDPSNMVWQLASNLLAPLVDGGSRRAQVKIATAEQEQALAAYAQTALEAFGEVENNLDLANTLVLRMAQLQESLNQSEQAYRIAQLSHKEGEISLLDLLTLQQRVLSARSNLSSLERQTLEQRVNVYMALGGDWQEP